MPCSHVLQLIPWLCPRVFKWLVMYAALRSFPQTSHRTLPSWRPVCVRSLSLVAKATGHVSRSLSHRHCQYGVWCCLLHETSHEKSSALSLEALLQTGHSKGFWSEWESLCRLRWYTSRKAFPHIWQAWFLTGLLGFLTAGATAIAVLLALPLGLVPEEDAVTVDRMPAMVETNEVLLLSPVTVEMQGTT